MTITRTPRSDGNMTHTSCRITLTDPSVPDAQPPSLNAPAPPNTDQDEVLRGLLRRCAQHDEVALARLYALTSPWVYALVTRYTSSTTQAADAMVAIYSTVWREAVRHADDDRSILAWITSIAFQRIGSGTGQPSRHFDAVRSET